MVKLHFEGPPPNLPPRGGRAQESSPPPSWGRVRVGGHAARVKANHLRAVLSTLCPSDSVYQRGTDIPVCPGRWPAPAGRNACPPAFACDTSENGSRTLRGSRSCPNGPDT